MNKKIVAEYYLLSIIGKLGMSFTFGTYVIFLREHGLDLFQVNMINFVYYAMLTFCEIPTGAFADIFGRKKSYIVSCILMALGLLIYACSGNWLLFITAESVIAIGATFRSGAFSAWFVDRIRHDGYDGSLNKIFSRAEQLQRITSMIAVVIGSALSEIWSPFPFILGAVSFLINALVALYIKEEYFVKQKISFRTSFDSFKRITKDSFKVCKNNEAVKFILVLVSIQLFAIQTLNMHWQPFFSEWVDNKIYFGFIMVGINLSLLLGNWLAPIIIRKTGSEKNGLIICQLLIAVFIIGASLCSSFSIAIIIFYAHEVFRGSYAPINDAYLHENIDSKERATITSFESLAKHGSGMFGLLISGLLARNLGIHITWFIMGCFLLLTTLYFAKNGKK